MYKYLLHNVLHLLFWEAKGAQEQMQNCFNLT